MLRPMKMHRIMTFLDDVSPVVIECQSRGYSKDAGLIFATLLCIEDALYEPIENEDKDAQR